MQNERDSPRDKTIGELAGEAFSFLSHTLFAVILLAIVIGVMSLNHPDPDDPSPKLVCTVFAFMVPMFGGLIIARIQQNHVARYVWISGLVLFAVVCVWVLDLPTGNGLCQACGAGEKLWRTFFTFSHGSGLMGGDGLLIGTWLPISMVSYAIGARFGLEP